MSKRELFLSPRRKESSWRNLGKSMAENAKMNQYGILTPKVGRTSGKESLIFNNVTIDQSEKKSKNSIKMSPLNKSSTSNIVPPIYQGKTTKISPKKKERTE